MNNAQLNEKATESPTIKDVYEVVLNTAHLQKTTLNQMSDVCENLIDNFQRYQKMLEDFKLRLENLEHISDESEKLVDAYDGFMAYEQSESSSLVSIAQQLKDLGPSLEVANYVIQKLNEIDFSETLKSDIQEAVQSSIDEQFIKDTLRKITALAVQIPTVMFISTIGLLALNLIISTIDKLL